MKLEDFLDKLANSQLLWISPRRAITVGDLKCDIAFCRKSIQDMDVTRISLELSDSIRALTWMIALDGVAEFVFLAAGSLQQSDAYESLIRRYQPSLIVNELLDSKARSYKSVEVKHAARARVATSWVLATSGTTGAPKLIEHSTETLTRTCKAGIDRRGGFVWGLVYDPFTFAGLQVVLQALASGSPLVLCTGIGSIAEQASFLRENKSNALSATPTYWRKLLMSAALRGHNLRQITLGGELADQSVLNALKSAFPDARIAHIYASTEAGVGFSVTDGLMGFPIRYLEGSTAGNELRISSAGTLQIKVKKYPHSLGRVSLADEDGFIDSGDLVAIRGERVVFLGRDSGAINVGGNKVIPEEVESVIREVEGIGEVIVRPKGSGVVGQLVTADIQPLSPEADKAALKRVVMAHCRERLEKYKVPALVRFVDEIEHNPTGKVRRT